MEKCKEKCISSTLMPLYRTAKFKANLIYSYDNFNSILAKVEAIFFSFHTRLSMILFYSQHKIDDDWLNDQLDSSSIHFKSETALNFYSWNYSLTEQDVIFCFTKYLLLKYVHHCIQIVYLLYSKTAHKGKNMLDLCFVATCTFKQKF